MNTYEIFLRRCDWPARRFSHLDALAGELPRSRRCVVVDCHDPGGIDQYLSLQDRLGDGPSVLLLPSHCPASRIAKTCRGHTQILHKVPDTSTLLRAVESAARCASGSS